LITENATDIDKLNEILTRKTNLSLVHSVDGHSQSLVHSHRAIGRSHCGRVSHWQRRKVHRTLPNLDVLQQPLLMCSLGKNTLSLMQTQCAFQRHRNHFSANNNLRNNTQTVLTKTISE